MKPNMTLYYGVRTAALAAGVDDFRAAGCEVKLASDDGTLGTKGFVTQLLNEPGLKGAAVTNPASIGGSDAISGTSHGSAPFAR